MRILAAPPARAAELHAVGRVDLRHVSKDALIHMVVDIGNINVVGLSGLRCQVLPFACLETTALAKGKT